jgi:hypothetical protein
MTTESVRTRDPRVQGIRTVLREAGPASGRQAASFCTLLRHGNPRGQPRQLADGMDDFDRDTRRAVLRPYRATNAAVSAQELSAVLRPLETSVLVRPSLLPAPRPPCAQIWIICARRPARPARLPAARIRRSEIVRAKDNVRVDSGA